MEIAPILGALFVNTPNPLAALILVLATDTLFFISWLWNAVERADHPEQDQFDSRS